MSSETSQAITSEEDLRAHLAQPGPVWLFKHSSSCGISTAAYDEYGNYLSAKPDQGAAHIVIQSHRPLSNLTAQILSRVHQSPQLFLLANGEVLWAASHWSITVAAMDKAWKDAQGS